MTNIGLSHCGRRNRDHRGHLTSVAVVACGPAVRNNGGRVVIDDDRLILHEDKLILRASVPFATTAAALSSMTMG
jgi:hypothetical protein